ncbi:hypothetical protein IMZ11_20230 [Microtetraspora sp. AC03309]|uniref:hypothetical protein n=1 Tax=Microtetraspora sp. AC03309 TaxID=2779376 RepID=UPI001E283913|nr:hypothetical protein [Microtetraspora sp. AC03309]MCC5577958.1 hypothetical protein [Microtetraspora sp. AC03309]
MHVIASLETLAPTSRNRREAVTETQAVVKYIAVTTRCCGPTVEVPDLERKSAAKARAKSLFNLGNHLNPGRVAGPDGIARAHYKKIGEISAISNTMSIELPYDVATSTQVAVFTSNRTIV